MGMPGIRLLKVLAGVDRDCPIAYRDRELRLNPAQNQLIDLQCQAEKLAWNLACLTNLAKDRDSSILSI